MLTRLAALMDTAGYARRARAAREGAAGRARPGVGFFATPRAQYRDRSAAKGPAIVFCADPPLTLEAYDDLIALLAPRFRVIVFEAPAMGFSAARPRYGFGFRETVDDIALFLRAVAGPGAGVDGDHARGSVGGDRSAGSPGQRQLGLGPAAHAALQE